LDYVSCSMASVVLNSGSFVGVASHDVKVKRGSVGCRLADLKAQVLTPPGSLFPTIIIMAAPLEKTGFAKGPAFEQAIPEPVVARRAQRSTRVRKALLGLVALVAVVHFGSSLYTHMGGKDVHPHSHRKAHHHGKPKGPLTPDEAKELFL
jgi:hypothetical protein